MREAYELYYGQMYRVGSLSNAVYCQLETRRRHNWVSRFLGSPIFGSRRFESEAAAAVLQKAQRKKQERLKAATQVLPEAKMGKEGSHHWPAPASWRTVICNTANRLRGTE